ncbi:hypothetical protein Esti_003632 [Eimeria stiedai]
MAGVPAEGERDRLVKSNILYIDGRNLHQSRMLEYHPLGRTEDLKSPDDHDYAESNRTLLTRYVGEILTALCKSDSRYYARGFGVPLDDYMKSWKNYFKCQPAVVLHEPPYVIEQTIWYVVKKQYRFQTDNLYNQLEDVCVSILNLSLVELPAKAPFIGGDVLLAAIDTYHSRLFSNYYKWCDYLGTAPFPWRNPPWLEDSFCYSDNAWSTQTRQEVQQMMFELATFKLLWAESANLRHTPELLCWLFHWLCMAWDKKFTPEEDFIDLIRDLIQRIRDEQWYMASALRTPDHNARLLYDDFNELFWDRRCLDILTRSSSSTDSQEHNAVNQGPSSHPSTHDGSSLEAQNKHSMDRHLSRNTGSHTILAVSRENLNAVITELTCSSKAGSGIKTFIERRTYAQVLRNFWRVFAWHVTTFAGIILLYALKDEESSYSVRKQWAILTLAASLSYGMLPIFDLMLVNYRALTKPHYWSFAWRKATVHAARLAFALAALITVATEGLASESLQWNGLLSLFYWCFFLCHGGHYFLYVRIHDRMPLFILLWSCKWLGPLSKPSTFTGSVPLLAENLTHVLRYSLFWLVAMLAKALYWLYIILPPMVAASSHVAYVSCRPVYINSAILWPGHLPVMLQGFIWIPAFRLGNRYGRHFGNLFGLPWFVTSEMTSLLPQHHKSPARLPTGGGDRYYRRGTFFKTATGPPQNQPAYVPAPSFALPSAAHDFRKSSVRYANTNDPYMSMVILPLLVASLRPTSSGEGAREKSQNMLAYKKFGFLWNEIVQSWRAEDIISYAEQEKLEFNELPHIACKLHNIGDLYFDCGRDLVDWRHSAVRHPTFIYCNELTAFLKVCEDFHYQASGDMLRLCSKQALARKFYSEYFSTDPAAKDPRRFFGFSDRFEKSMHLQACQEVAEALKLYLARYFSEGLQLISAMEEMWFWIDSDAERLLWLNFRGLKSLVNALQKVFDLAQKASFWMPDDSEKLVNANAELKKALLAMIMLPSNKPEELGGSNIPVVIQAYIKAVSICFGSPSQIGDMSSVLPAPLQRGEVAVMLEQLQIILKHTSLLLLSSEEESQATSAEDLPLLPEEVAELRALYAQLGEADASVVLGDSGSQNSKFAGRDPAELAKIASTEHALKLFFRRAARILKADDPSFRCAEAQRRFGTFINSILMKIPETPLVRNMVSMMTLTPYYREDTRLDLQDLEKRTDEGVCKMDLLRSLHPVEFDNFIERVDRDKDMFTIRQEIEDRVTDSPERRKLALQDIRAQMQQSGLLHRYDRFCELLQEWASYRGQVLMRTVYGIMYYEQAIKMQEKTAPEDLHLCRDSNRLDDTQLKIIRSPEGALWREVVGCTPPYELQQSTRELAHLKYQYVVAAQEFGTDLGAQMPRDGCEPSPALRAQLLRKVAAYKLLVRYPSLRIATLEQERSPEGRFTGHKVSVLYRLTADVDPVGERLAARAAASITQMRATGRFLRPTEQEVLPASIPALLVPPPRIPVCTPGANMEANSKVRLKPRSAGSSSGDRQSGEASSTVSVKTPTTPPEIRVKQISSISPTGIPKGRTAYHEGENIRTGEEPRSIQSSIVEGTRQLLTKGCEIPSKKISNFLNAGEDGGCGGTASSQEAQSSLGHSPPQRSRKSDAGAASGAGDFESKISRAIHWLHQKRQFDRTLFAARTKRALKKTISSSQESHEPSTCVPAEKDAVEQGKLTTSEGPQDSLLSRLCQDLRHDLSEAPGITRAARIVRKSDSSRATKHSDTIRPDSQAALAVDEPQTQAQLQAAAVHSSSPHASLFRAHSTSHLTKIPEEYGEGECRLNGQFSQPMSSCADAYHFPEQLDKTAVVADADEGLPFFYTPRPTLLEAQFARDLARDFMGPAIPLSLDQLPSSSSHGSLNIYEEALSRRLPSHIISEQGSSHPHSLQTDLGRSDAATPLGGQLNRGRSRLRRHSIITLHPRKEELLPWDSLETLNTDSWDYDRVSEIRCNNSVPRVAFEDEAPTAHDTGSLPQTFVGVPLSTKVGVLLRQEASHRREYHASPRTQAVDTRTTTRMNSSEVQSPKSVWTGEEHEQGNGLLSKPSGSAAYRSNSLSKLRDGGFLSMQERVAFFEDRLSRHQAQMEAEACNIARKQQVSQRRGMLWPSRRGPLRLEAIYKIRLPLIMDESGAPWGRTPNIGPGKPENQNHAIAFSRMDTMQVMDMNMESYLEEAIKLRNLLQEFVLNARMRILGFREHIFTENVSSLASYMALQENLFTTTNQRLYFTPLRVRMHYGHPDIFDRYFIQTCGSCSKASNGINLSEDIFAGFNCTARGYCVHHADYIQCGKGRDVGLQQVVMFEKKVAGGNGEQVLSRDLNRLVLNMDFFRLLSLWFTGPGFFLNSVILVLAAYVCLYTKCFLAFAKYNYSGPVESALEYVLTPSTYIQFQLGMLLVLPLIPWLFLEKGAGSAIRKLIDLISKFSVTYYNFMTCTKASVIDHVLIYGGAKYQETGRGFVIERATLKDIWMFFYFTHFSIGLEMFVLLALYAIYGGLRASVFFLDTWPILLMAASINAVPFIFNPLGFYYPRLRQDFKNWNAWMASRELGVPKDSWVSWWRGEMEQRCNIVWHHKIIIVFRLLRFPLLAAGIISCVATSIQSADVDCAMYLMAASGLFVTMRTFQGDLQVVSPSAKAWLSLVLLAGAAMLVLWLTITEKVSQGSLICSFFALCLFIYGMLEIAFALLGRWAVRSDMFSDVVRTYHRCAGLCIFAPLLVLSALTTSVHHLQTRILFNPTFVSIVKSGIVQREQVEKSGHGHN